MTTIAYRNGVMASDSGVWIGDSLMPWARKLARAADGTLYGTAGNAAEASAFLAWVDAGRYGEPPVSEKLPEGGSSLLVIEVSPTGSVSLLTARGPERYGHVPYFAIGAGSVGALCAMHAGASAEVAIAAAIAHAEGAAGFVQWVRFDTAARITPESAAIASASPPTRTA